MAKGKAPTLPLPEELIGEIVTYCDFYSLEALSKSSRALRCSSVRHLFRSVRISAPANILVYAIKDLLYKERVLGVPDVLSHVSQATISIENPPYQENTSRYITPGLPGAMAYSSVADCYDIRRSISTRQDLTWLVEKCISSMTRLNSLALRFEDCQTDRHREMSQNTSTKAKWNIEKLRVWAPSIEQLNGGLASRCVPGSLKALQVFTYRGIMVDQTVWKDHPGLKRLYVPSWAQSREFMPDFTALERISQNFKELEWLVLATEYSQQYSMDTLGTSVQRYIGALNEMPKLRRLAFTLPLNLIPPARIPLARPNSRLTCKQRFLRRLVRHFIQGVKHLEEVCILHECPEYFKGIKGDDGTTWWSLMAAAEDRPTSTFPFGLDDE